MLKVYREEDADLGVLRGRTVAIVGYGNQGRAQGLNLRDSGVDVIIGGISDNSWKRAEADGFPVYAIGEAARRADILFMLIPDEAQPAVYESEIAGHLQGGDTLVFAHGYNIRFGLIRPADDVDVIMVAPRMIGKVVRDLYVEGSGAAAYVGVHQDATGRAMPTALAIAKGIGATRNAVIEQSFEEETDLDLLLEQTFDPAMGQVLLHTYEFLVEAGFAPEVVALELYASKELAETAAEMADIGFFKQMTYHSQTSMYGNLSRSDWILPGAVFKEKLGQALQSIRSGEFAREWAEEERQGYPEFNRLLEKALQHPLNEVEESLRRMVNLRSE
ncbi:MAG: ketol-acid reductoisomerase [Caldilineaceae bacterium]|nr:ketol-acid reductoisomerase [Caldilineaceae bacterium]